MSSPPSNPPSARSTPAPRARGGPRAGVTRKTKAERDKYAAEQAEREKKRITAPSTTAQNAARGRGAGRGGRGGAQRESNHAQSSVTGGGVFGGSSGATRLRDSKKGHSGQEEWLSGSAAKTEDIQPILASAQVGGSGSKSVVPGPGGTTDSSVPQRIIEQITAVASDDEADTGRRDIERIWISSEDEAADESEDEIVASRGKQKTTASSAKERKERKSGASGGGLRPVRAPRVHHEDEAEATEATHNIKPIGKRTKRESTTAPIVVDDSPDAMDIDTTDLPQQAIRDPTSSPELKKKSLAKRATPRSRDTRPYAQESTEERAERVRVSEDTSRLMSIFGASSHPSGHGPITAGTTEPSATAKGKGKLSAQMQEGRLFLMQFPPLTPMLIDPNATTTTSNMAGDTTLDVPIKADPDASGPTQKPQPAQQQQTVLTAPDLCPSPSTTSTRTKLPTGVLGKLRIHASGKVSLDWGGVDMEVRLGTDVDFLQDAVLVDSEGVLERKENEEREPETEGNEEWGDRAEPVDGDGDVGDKEGEQSQEGDGDGEGERVHGGKDKGKGKATNDESKQGKGKVYALGQVSGKLIVVPDWGRLYD